MNWEEALIIQSLKGRRGRSKSKSSSNRNTKPPPGKTTVDTSETERLAEETKATLEIYLTLEVYLAIFDAAARVLPRSRVKNIKWDYSESPPLGWLVPTDPYEDADHTTMDVPEHLIRGVRKHMLCDFSVISMFSEMQEKLKTQGASLEWMNLLPKAKHVFTYGDPAIHSSRPPKEKLLPTHSVFLITTADGNQLVADFTTEQFGYEATEWFDVPQEFLQTRSDCPNIYGLVDTSNIDNYALKWKPAQDMRIWMREFCRKLDWAEIEAIKDDERYPSVYNKAMRDFVSLADGAKDGWDSWTEPLVTDDKVEGVDSGCCCI